MSKQFTAAQLAELRAEYSRIGTIDPCGPSWPRLVAMLDGMTQDMLKQLRDERIPWLGWLAANRVKAIPLEEPSGKSS